jgi:23S rRNA pseudouridine2605 synthase
MTDKADNAPSQTDIPAPTDAKEDFDVETAQDDTGSKSAPSQTDYSADMAEEDEFDAEMPQDDFDADIDGETDLVEVEVAEEDLPRERIAKRIARSGVCSRRDAEQLIKTGKVKLNGRRLDTPAVTVTDNDVILINEKPLPEKQKPRLWRLFKKRGLVTSHRDEQGRDTVFNNLPPHIPRVISVGRLDLNSEGLLLLTNDGELARYLELPATGWARRYRVRVHGFIDDSKLKQLEEGITVDGVNYGSIQAEVDVQKGTNAWMTITLREGKNREIRRVMEHLGWPVTRLMRLSYGPFHLGKMAPGEIDEITGKVMKEQLSGFFGGDGSKAAAKRDNDNHGQAKAKPKKPKAHRKTPARSDNRVGPRDADSNTGPGRSGPRPFDAGNDRNAPRDFTPRDGGRNEDYNDTSERNNRDDRTDRYGNDSRGSGYNDRAPASRGRDNDRDDNRSNSRDDSAHRSAPQNRSFGGGNDRHERSGNDRSGGRSDNDSRDSGYQGRPSGRGGNPRSRDDASDRSDSTNRPLNKGRGRYAGGNAGSGAPAGRPAGHTGSKPAGNRPVGRGGSKPSGHGNRGDR